MGAWASNQSRPIASRQALEAQYEGVKVGLAWPVWFVSSFGLGCLFMGGQSAQRVAYVHTHMYNHNNQARFGGEVGAEPGAGGAAIPKPPHWGGFRLVPDRVEFWKGRQSRLHDRIVYTLGGKGGKWAVERLQP